MCKHDIVFHHLTNVLGAAALFERLSECHIIQTIHLGQAARRGLGPAN